MSTQDERDLAGAAALHALSPEELERYERLLERSEDARAEANELGDTAAILGAAVTPVAPSAALRENLLSAIASTPQLPAVEAEPQAEPVAPVVSLAARRRRRPIVLLAAAAAVVVAGVGISVGVLTPRGPIAELRAAADLQTAETTTVDGAAVEVLWSEQLDRAAVVSDELPVAGEGLVYQLWMIDAEGGATPAGLFDGGAAVETVLDGDLADGDVIGITVEPAGGSEQPTTTPILVQAT